MNIAIARELLKAMRNPSAYGYPIAGGDCQMFVRMVVERSGDPLAKTRMDEYRRGTAALTAEAFAPTPYVVWDMRGQVPNPDEMYKALNLIEAGDCVYKDSSTSGETGHAAIAFHNLIEGDSRLCFGENSSFHLSHPDYMGTIVGHGAVGWRLPSDFGPFNMIVRV